MEIAIRSRAASSWITVGLRNAHTMPSEELLVVQYLGYLRADAVVCETTILLVSNARSVHWSKGYYDKAIVCDHLKAGVAKAL